MLPPPSRVSAFFATVMVDYAMAGSPERPFYLKGVFIAEWLLTWGFVIVHVWA